MVFMGCCLVVFGRRVDDLHAMRMMPSGTHNVPLDVFVFGSGCFFGLLWMREVMQVPIENGFLIFESTHEVGVLWG